MAVAEDTRIEFMNSYTCPTCENEWDDQWSSIVDDDCAECGLRHISPHTSEPV